MAISEQNGIDVNSTSPNANVANSVNPLASESELPADFLRSFKQKLSVASIGYIGDGTKLYKRRFWMLFIYSVSSMFNALLWIQFSSISSIVQCYYQVDAYAVNWTSEIFLVVYLFVVLPISWFMDRYGLKPTVLAGSITNCLSTIVQCAAIHRDRFYLLFISQTIAAVGNAIVLPIPPRLAAVWFGANEVCRATSFGVFGNQLGIAVGFLIPSLSVSNECTNPDQIGKDLGIMTYCLTGVNILNLMLLIFTYQTKPPLPPSQVSKVEERIEYKKSLLSLLKNFNFYWLVLTYGLAIGISLTVSALLNQMLAPLFNNAEQTIGWMGMSQIIAGFISSLLCGYILDKTHKFKLITLMLCGLGFFAMAAFTGILHISSIGAQFVTVILIGFFLNGFFPVGLEFASEITYPEPEGTVAGIMNASSMLFALIFTSVGSYLQQSRGTLTTCIFFCFAILLSILTCIMVKSELRRTTKNMQKDDLNLNNSRKDEGVVNITYIPDLDGKTISNAERTTQEEIT